MWSWFRNFKEKREVEIINCLHPQEFRFLKDICERLHKNRQENCRNKRIKKTSLKTIESDLLRLCSKGEVELSIEVHIFPWECERCGGIHADRFTLRKWKLSGDGVKRKAKKKESEKSLSDTPIPQPA